MKRTVRNKLARIIMRVVSAGLIFSAANSVLAEDITDIDKLTENKKYEQAITGYFQYAELGSPNAFYKLGSLYLKGLGVEKDVAQAFIWFALAAEHQYDNSAAIVEQLFAHFDAKQQSALLTALVDMQKKWGKQATSQNLLAELNPDTLSSQVVFRKGDDIQDPDALIVKLTEQNNDEEFAEEEGDDTGFAELEPFSESDDDSFVNTSGSNLTNRTLLKDRDYFLVVDHEIESDGSMRDFVPAFTIGNYAQGIKDLRWHEYAKPTLDNTSVAFLRRTYMGIANYNKWQIISEYRGLYLRVLRKFNKVKTSNNPHEQFSYFKALSLFPWLPREDGEMVNGFKKTAEANVPDAQYEYGMYLYRNQENVAEGIQWISKAAQNGVDEAEYRLAKILFDSPWVIKDEKKALFWFERAAKEGNHTAKRKVALLKLAPENDQLKDVLGAKTQLNAIPTSERGDPEYMYLTALYLRYKDTRDHRGSINKLTKAIDMAKGFKWDTTKWQQLLKRWTQTRVKIWDIDNN